MSFRLFRKLKQASLFSILRRKMTRLGELFIFKNRKKNEPQHEKEKK